MVALYFFLPEVFFSITLFLYLSLSIIFTVIFRKANRVPILSSFSFSCSLITILRLYLSLFNVSFYLYGWILR